MRVVRRKRFLSDLASAHTHLTSKSPAAAEGFLVEVERLVNLLHEFPKVGRGREELSPGVRSFRVRRYRHLLFYRAHPDRLILLRLIHGARKIGPGAV